MSTSHKLLAGVLLLSLALSFATPVYAFDGRSGEIVTIQSGDVVNDDLYVAANEFVLDGSVNGDVISGANMITINGKVDGNLIAAGQTVVVNGVVTGDVLAAGSVLYFGEASQVGGDIVSAGYSLELHTGTSVGRDAVLGAYQILIGGDIGRNIMAGANSLEIDGTIGGNAKVAIAEPAQRQSQMPPGMFLNETTVPVPSVRPGLTIDPAARIKGNLTYVQQANLTFPAGVVAGTITRQSPPPEEGRQVIDETAAQKVGAWALNIVRTLVSLILLGLLMAWLLPGFVRGLGTKLESKPWPSLGLGIVSWAAVIFLGLLILFTAILGAVIFGVLTLGGISGAILWIGILALFVLIVGFVLAASFLAKIVFGQALGRWLLTRMQPSLAEGRYWPMVIGVTVVVLAVGLLSFPLVTGALGWLLNLVVVLFGLGAIWLWGSDQFARKSVPAA